MITGFKDDFYSTNSNILNFNLRHRPLLNYSFITSLDESGNRQLVDTGSAPKYNAELYFGIGLKFNGVDQSIPTTISGRVNTIVYFNGVDNIFDETLQILDNYEINKELSSGIRNNYIFYNGIFTDNQKTYLKYNPEKFLYREDGVLKSMILTQSEIDNIVAYFPMCETDGYIRDLVEYSEGDEEINFSLSNWNINNDSGNSSITEDENGNIVIDYVSTDDVFLNISQDIASNNDLFLLEITIESISGSIKIQDNDTSALFGVFNTTGTFYKIAYIDAGNLIVARDKSDEDVTATISNIVLKKLTGTYQIKNYTDNMRLDAKQLSTGLQTCFWERDNFGVPFKSSFRALCPDKCGYADTGFIPDSKKSWTMEIVLDFDQGNLPYNYFGAKWLNVQVGIRNNGTALDLTCGDLRFFLTLNKLFNGKLHLGLSYNSITGKTIIGSVANYKSGDANLKLCDENTIDTFSLGLSLYKGNLQSTSEANGADKKLYSFKIYDDFRNITKLYIDRIPELYPDLKLFAHQGLGDLAPGNTMIAYKNAKSLGMKIIDGDMCISKDRIPFMRHDNTITYNGDVVEVNSLTMEELSTIDVGSEFSDEFAGETIPTLDEVCKYASGNGLGITFEMKHIYSNDDVDTIMEVINRYKYISVTVQHTTESYLIYLRSKYPEIRVFYILFDNYMKASDVLDNAGVYYLRSYLDNNPQVIEEYANAGVEIATDTIYNLNALALAYKQGLRSFYMTKQWFQSPPEDALVDANQHYIFSTTGHYLLPSGTEYSPIIN